MWKWGLAAVGGVVGVSCKSDDPYVPQDGWWNAEGFEQWAPFVFNLALPFVTGYIIVFVLLWIIEGMVKRKDHEPEL